MSGHSKWHSIKHKKGAADAKRGKLFAVLIRQFERKGVVLVDKSADEDELTLAAADAGAEDVQDFGDSWQVTTPPTELHAARAAIEEAGFKVKSSDLTMIPTTSVALADEGPAK